jgi:hypothetical protein
MRIGRKDVKPKQPEPAAPADPKAAEAEAARQKELEQKYAAPKAFDWSRVRGSSQRRKEEKRARREEAAANAAADVDAGVAPARKSIKREHAIAGAIVGVLLAILSISYVVRSTGELAPALTVEQAKQEQAAEQRGAREVLSKLEKEYGSDHPQVRQMKMELGDAPTPPK